MNIVIASPIERSNLLTNLEIASSERTLLATTGYFDCGKMAFARGSRQVVRHQPSKLIFVGSNPISRSP